MPLARDDERNAAAVPTSAAVSASGSGEFVAQYSTIALMMPIALAARDAYGPALIVFTRNPCRRPAPSASVRLLPSKRAPPAPPPGPHDPPPRYREPPPPPAMYDSDRNAPFGRISGGSRCTMLTRE